MTDWLIYLGVAESVVTIDKGKLGHELKVVPPGLSQPHDLTHVGVGVSQVLPILVMCLLADPDTTLVFEQPELHLPSQSPDASRGLLSVDGHAWKAVRFGDAIASTSSTAFVFGLRRKKTRANSPKP